MHRVVSLFDSACCSRTCSYSILFFSILFPYHFVRLRVSVFVSELLLFSSLYSPRFVMSSSLVDIGVSGSTVSGGNVTTLKLSRLIPTGYAKWKPEAENCFKRGGMKESDYKKEIKGFMEMRKHIEELEEQELTNAYEYLIKKGQSNVTSTASIASSSTLASKTASVSAVDNEAEAHNKKMKGVIERSGKVYAMVYECLPDEIRLLVNNNKAIIEGYGYSLWRWLEEKYQSTESDSIGKLWNDFVSAKQLENELFDAYKARVDEVVELLHHAGDTIPNALYATIMMDRLVPRYNSLKMVIDSSSELGKDRKKMDWVVVTKFIQQQERNLARQSEGNLDTASTNGQAMSANAHIPRKPYAPPAKSNDPDLPYKGKDNYGCWCCGKKNHSYRRCFKWLAKHSSEGNSSSTAPSRTSSPSRSTVPGGAATNSMVATDAREGEKKTSCAVMVKKTICTIAVNPTAMKPVLKEKLIRFAEKPAGPTPSVAVSTVAGGSVHISSKEKSVLKPILKATIKSMPINQESDESKSFTKCDWGIDSMSSIGATGNRSLLGNIRKSTLIEVTVANGQVVSTDQVGDVMITIQCAKGERYTFVVTVYYHPCFAANLLSAQRLGKEDFDVRIGKKSCIVTPDGKTAILRSGDDLTILESSSVPASVKQPESAMSLGGGMKSLKTAEDLMRMHVLFGHCAWSTLLNILTDHKTEDVGRFQVPEAEIRKAVEAMVHCKVCMESAGKCAPYGHRGLDRGVRMIESLHFDTFYVKNGETTEYGLVVRDGFANTTMVYSMNNRDADTCCPLVVDCINYMETQTSLKVKRLHSDGGGEFVNAYLKDYCRRKGIVLHYGPKDKHQLNGMAENGVQTTKYGIRKLLRQSGLPDIPFWRYAAKHFMFIWNRSRASKYTGKTPYEALHGKKPTCERWGVFGCDVEYHIPKGDRATTFSRTMEPGIYLGHDPARNCPAVYCLSTGKVIYTRDVTYLLHSFENAKRLVHGNLNGAVPQVEAQDDAAPPPAGAIQKLKYPPGLPLDSESKSREAVGEETYEVEQIVDHRTRRGRKEYQVKWVGYPIEQSTWQRKAQLIEDGCQLSIDRYEAALKGEPLPDPEEEAEAVVPDESKPNLNVGPDHEAAAMDPKANPSLSKAKSPTLSHAAAPSSEEYIESELNEDEAIERALVNSLSNFQEETINQAQAALSCFNTGYEKSPNNDKEKLRRMELICSIASGTALLEQQTPRTYKEAVTCEHAKKWIESMKVEWETLEGEGVWDYVKRDSLPHCTNILPSKFVFKVKLKDNGDIEKFKSRLVAGGHRQKHGIDFNEVYSSTGKYKTMRIMMSLAAKFDYDLHQMDVPSAFVKGSLPEEDEVYMEIPDGFREGHAGEVLKLKKGLYGLHQSGRIWWLLVSGFLTNKMGFKQSVSDPNYFYKTSKTGRLMTIFLFVDDFQASTAREDRSEWDEYLNMLKQEFNIKYLGEPKWLLGMKISRDRKRGLIKLDQELYVTKSLERFGLSECRTADTPEEVGAKKGAKFPSSDDDVLCDRNQYMEKVGTAIYAAISTRPDIAHAVYQCAKKMQKPTEQDMKSIDRVFRYLAGTRTFGLIFGSRNGVVNNFDVGMCAYSDADWGSSDDRKSLTGWVAKLNGDPISWSCKKQSVVAQSTCEAELYAEAAAVNEMLWLTDLIGELGIPVAGDTRLNGKEDSGVIVYCDNQSTIKVSKNGIKADRTKHVDIKYHFITDVINEKKVALKWIPTDKQQADIFTKALNKEAFIRHRNTLMNDMELIEA